MRSFWTSLLPIGLPRRAARGLALGASLLLAGCSQSCPPSKCPTATTNLRALDDSTVTWTFRGQPAESATGFVAQSPSGADCAFEFNKGWIFPGFGDGGAETVDSGFSDLICAGGGSGHFDFVLSKLGDPRAWSVGTFPLTAAGGSAASDLGSGSCPVAYLNGMTMTVTVETATGGAAPYPKLVTDDFERTFRLSFDSSSVTPTMSDGLPCDYPLTAQVSLHLTQTAADYVYDPNAPCICE